MRDSALKLNSVHVFSLRQAVGEELMRDSALKRNISHDVIRFIDGGRRRAHARQRFETNAAAIVTIQRIQVGEELMRDSALKLFSAGISVM